MSKIRNRDLKKRGCTCKDQRSIVREYAIKYIKQNRLYAINNMCFHLGLNNKFTIQSS